MVSFCRAPYSDGKATAEEKEATKLYNNAKKYVKNSGVTYYSKDPSIATVNANGKITAKGKGTTEIVAVTKEKSLKKTIVVTVR